MTTFPFTPIQLCPKYLYNFVLSTYTTLSFYLYNFVLLPIQLCPTRLIYCILYILFIFWIYYNNILQYTSGLYRYTGYIGIGSNWRG
ncbi:hypothetical protein J2T59_001175 [Methanosalsum natronophilum]|nr:hypothetical protein [Methanosalsum natronophilum]